MGIINRSLLFLYALALSLLSLFGVILCLQLIPGIDVLNEWQYLIEHRDAFIGVTALMFILSIHFIVLSISTNKDIANEREMILEHAAQGDIKISLVAVKDLVEKMSMSVRGVRDAQAKVVISTEKSNHQNLILSLKVAIAQQVNIVSVSNDISSQIKKYFTDTIGMTEPIINISVMNITNTYLSKKKRVV